MNPELAAKISTYINIPVLAFIYGILSTLIARKQITIGRATLVCTFIALSSTLLIFSMRPTESSNQLNQTLTYAMGWLSLVLDFLVIHWSWPVLRDTGKHNPKKT